MSQNPIEGGAAGAAARAEFRVFGHGVIDSVRERLFNGKTLLLQARRMPAETYLLSAHTDDANVKLRAGLLDVKLKVAQTPEGYEVFEPRGKWALPIDPTELASALAPLQAGVPPDAPHCDADALVAWARAQPALRVVVVEKMRYGFSIEGVLGEYAQVWFNGALLETACIESTEPARMADVIEGLGLAGRPNTSYVRAAKRVAGLA